MRKWWDLMTLFHLDLPNRYHSMAQQTLSLYWPTIQEGYLAQASQEHQVFLLYRFILLPFLHQSIDLVRLQYSLSYAAFSYLCRQKVTVKSCHCMAADDTAVHIVCIKCQSGCISWFYCIRQWLTDLLCITFTSSLWSGMICNLAQKKLKFQNPTNSQSVVLLNLSPLYCQNFQGRLNQVQSAMMRYMDRRDLIPGIIIYANVKCQCTAGTVLCVHEWATIVGVAVQNRSGHGYKCRIEVAMGWLQKGVTGGRSGAGMSPCTNFLRSMVIAMELSQLFHAMHGGLSPLLHSSSSQMRWLLTSFMEHQDTNMNIYIIKRRATAEWQRVAKQGWDDSIQQFSIQPPTYLFRRLFSIVPQGCFGTPHF